MRPYIILVIIGVIVAGLAALAVRSSTTPAGEPVAVAAPTTTKVLIAKETITAGSFVRADTALTWGDWPAETVQPTYVTEGAGDLHVFDGAVARRTIFAGEPITQGIMAKPGEGGFMSAVLQAGHRAVSVPVNATTGNAGFIFPGDHVDLILTHTIQGMNNQSFASETFVQDVRVLAVDQQLNNPENVALLAKTVTLEVTPRQAEAINVALEMGKISLALRSLAADEQPESAAQESDMPTDTANDMGLEYFYPDANLREYTRDRDISKLLGNEGSAGAPTRVRVIRGEESTELEFSQPAP